MNRQKIRSEVAIKAEAEWQENGLETICSLDSLIDMRLREIGSNWDHRFLVLSQHIAGWSKDPTTKVGCVVVDEQRHIVSTGYNGFARGVNDTHARLHEREVKYKLVIHAEKNALLHAQRDLRGCTLYVWPMPPCSQCAAAIVQSGIKRVVSVSPSEEHLDEMGRRHEDGSDDV
jgi:dCMP deaminase